MHDPQLIHQHIGTVRSVVALMIPALLLAGVAAAGQAGDKSIDTAAPSADRATVALPEGTVTDPVTAPRSAIEDGSLGAGVAPSSVQDPGAPTGASAAPDAGTPAPNGKPSRLPVGPGVHGVTDTTIEIGLITTDATAVNGVGAALGATGTGEGAGNYDAVNAAAVDLVNSMGGIAGREVKPVYYFANASDIVTSSGRQQQNQSMCAHWTEDNHVFAMWGGTSTEEIMFECAVNTQTPMMLTRYGLQPSQQRLASMAGYWYTASFFVADRREQALATFLLAHEFFDKDAKVGLMVEDKPDTRDGVDQGMKPALAAAGIEPVVEIAYPDPIDSPWTNYVLQLQAAGVTHVVWSHPTIGEVENLFMMRAAEDQRYRPKWGFASDNGLDSLIRLSAPPDQLANVLGMGSKPPADVADFTPQSDNGRLCIETMKKNAPGEENNLYAWEVCDFLFFLRAGFERADDVSPAGFAAGVARLDTSFGATMNIGGATRFARGRPDGTAVVRAVEYDRAANVMKYTTGPEPVPE